MPPELEPPELARLIDFAERPREQDWSLRAALVRYAQGQPRRVSEVMELVRRLEFAIRPRLKSLARDGSAVWAALQSDNGESEAHAADPVVPLLQCMVELDRLGDAMAAWAADPSGDRPDAAVDATVADLSDRFERLDVPREERQRPPRQRG